MLAGPVQALHVLCTCYAVDLRTVRLCLVHAVHVPAATLQLRIAVMLTRTLILVLTCRAHMHPLLDALGPVRRALRAGLLLTGVHVSAAEAAPGGAIGGGGGAAGGDGGGVDKEKPGRGSAKRGRDGSKPGKAGN